MKMIGVIITMLFFLNELSAQTCDGKKFEPNNVPNGNFETTIANCAADIGAINSAAEASLGWTAIGGDDSKVFYINDCSGSGTYDPLANIHGTQAPIDGNGYISVVSGPFNGLTLPEEHYKGYVARQLNSPLLKGVTYYIEFNVSLADIARYGVNSLGLYLTANVNDLTPPTPDRDFHHLTPQIPNSFPAASAYLNYTGWTKICGYYTPTVDNVQYILIGNFRSWGYQQSASTGYNGTLLGRPVYYIDGVYVSEYSCCPEEQYYQNTSALPATTSVDNRIVAGSNVAPGTAGPVTISSGQSVVFKAGNMIQLEPNFNAAAGSSFVARIGTCTRGVDDNQLNAYIDFQETSQYTYSLTAVVTNSSGNYSYSWSTGATSQSISGNYGFYSYTVVVTDNETDQNYSAPCDVRVGIAEFIDNCPICRRRSGPEPEDVAVSAEDPESEASAVAVFPNPSNGKFNLKMNTNIVRYTVHNMQGQVLIENTNDNPSATEIDLSGKPKGIYVLRAIDSKNKSITQLIIVE